MISMMYAGLCTLLVIYLALRVVKWRREHKIGLGHGDNIELQCRVRAHANATENMPLALILLGSLELTGYSPVVIHVLGGVFFMYEGYSKGRFWGMAFTWLPMIIMAVFAIIGSIMLQIPKAY
jgi:uncharacterized membrane protein YecN with MAPEG domain